VSGTAVVEGDDIVIAGLTLGEAKEVKSIGARWSGARGAWTLPATALNCKLANDLSISLPVLRVELRPPGAVLDSRLYPYQRDAAARLVTAPHGQLVVLSPGLGKTAVAIAAADVAVPDDKVVVVAPASLLRTWEREIGKWATVPGDVYIMEGKVDFEAAAGARWIVASWDKAVREAESWGRGWPLWVLDESVLTKSRASKRFKTLQKIRKHVDRVWLLSGSPTTRYADDLWAQLHIIWPRAFPSYWRFAERYTVVEDNIWSGGRSVVGARSGRDAASENSDLVIVVNQEDVLDLPEYLFETIDCEMVPPQAKAYRDMEKLFIAELGDGSELVAANEVARLMRLQQIASCWDGLASGKHDVLVDRIKSYEPPYLVWTHWREGAATLTYRLQKAGLRAVHVAGDTTTRDRDAIIEGFKAGEHDTLVLSLGVGKFGLTMTGVKTVFWVDKSWNADDYFQALHRVRRIGLKHSPVSVTLRCPGTVDELVEDNLEGKLGGISRLTQSSLATLLKGLGR
jgi:SNF2 family DNA or RNA helicase